MARPLVILATLPRARGRRVFGELLALPQAEHARIAATARKAVEARWSWAGIAARLLQPFN